MVKFDPRTPPEAELKFVIPRKLFRVFFENGLVLLVEGDHDPDYGYDSWPVWEISKFGSEQEIIINPQKVSYVICLGELKEEPKVESKIEGSEIPNEYT